MTRSVSLSKLTSTQAGGAVATVVEPTMSRAPHWNYFVHAQVTTTATGAPGTATAGTLSVKARPFGASVFQELGVINLVAPEPAVFNGFYEQIQAVSAGFDADKTWTLFISAGE